MHWKKMNQLQNIDKNIIAYWTNKQLQLRITKAII